MVHCNEGSRIQMYDLSDLFRYSGLTALGLALAATGLPANAAVATADTNTVNTYLGTSGANVLQPSREDRAQRRAERGNRGERRNARRDGGDRSANRGEMRQQRNNALQQQRQQIRQQARQQQRQVDRQQQRTGDQAAWAARDRARADYLARQTREDRRELRQDARQAIRRGERQDYRQAQRRADRRDYRQAERREDRRDYRRAERRADIRDYRRADRRAYRQAERRWDRSWRNNNRYNWHRYRAQNRRHFSLGRYYAPYRNYSYRRIGIGFTLGSLFFGNRYWINDPWSYRLPEVYGPYKWVRYYDDVLLVNTYTGEVVDVIHDFFW